jgi:DNA repair exonuclease SbcCD ATPase subunit
VPIVNAPIEAERVSVWNRAAGSGRPLRAAWLTNTTNLTLDGGTFSVVEARAFAGEGIVEPLKPGEKRLVSYGTDLAVQIDARNSSESGRFVRVHASGGIMVLQREERSQWTYRIRNEDSTPRTVIVEHPVRDRWTLMPGTQPVETTPAAMRFRVQVGVRSEASLVVPERIQVETRIDIAELHEGQLQVYAQGGLDVDALRTALQPIREKQRELEEVHQRGAQLANEMQTLTQDQTRLRENMKALRGSKEEKALTLRYTRALAEQEDRVAALREQSRAVDAARETVEEELARLLRTWSFDLVRPWPL